MILLINNDRIVAELLDETYEGPMKWIMAPSDYVVGSFRFPASYRFPTEIPRYCGILAIKRHRLVEIDEEELPEEALSSYRLEELPEDLSGEEHGLYAKVIAYRDSLPPGATLEKMNASLFDVQHWVRSSPSIQGIGMVLGLTDEQLDQLFIWADAIKSTL